MHKRKSPRPAKRAADLGPKIAADRAAQIKWKDLELKYGLSRARLDQIWGDFKGRYCCACPSCGHTFDPKRNRQARRQSTAGEPNHGASRTQT